MLLNLRIENFVLLEKLELDFSNGLCVLTGETGAGKSLIIDAVEALLGGRVSAEQIKTNAKNAYLEANFKSNASIGKVLSENGFDETENILTISRTIQKSGSRFRINGQLTTQGLIKQIGENLLDIIGQHENQYLFKTEKHRQIIDLLGNEEHRYLQEKVKNNYQKLTEAKKEFSERHLAYKENKRQVDFYNFQLQEITEADPKIGEDLDLKQQRDVLLHAEELINNLDEAYYELSGSDHQPGINSRLNNLGKILQRSARFDSSLEKLSEELDCVLSQLRDFAALIRDHSESVDANPQKLEELESRITLLNKLKSKYGPEIEDVLYYRDELSEKLNSLSFDSERLIELKKEILTREKDYREKAELLSRARSKISEELEPLVEKELNELGMEKTIFKVNFSKNETLFSENGFDSLEFLLSPNPGEPLKPLSKTASGGEVSRIMLALKMVLNKISQVPTLIFDEIDTGISGKAAKVVSEKLAGLSLKTQIICITHLPVVAAMAEQHFWIEKTIVAETTKVEIKELDEQMRIEKLAQITGAKLSESSLKHAREMYQNARDFRKKLK